MEPLLRMSLIKDAGIRRIVQEILHTLIDRHDNLSKLKTVGSGMLEFFITYESLFLEVSLLDFVLLQVAMHNYVMMF